MGGWVESFKRLSKPQRYARMLDDRELTDNLTLSSLNASGATPGGTVPTPTPTPTTTSTQDVVSNVLTLPSQFKKKSADKITNFNPSTDILEIDTDSFGIDSSATFAAGKNKKAVKKQLAKQDIDFLYDQKKGWLYFNENGSDKGFGDGGLIAILKGAPDLTSSNLEFV